MIYVFYCIEPLHIFLFPEMAYRLLQRCSRHDCIFQDVEAVRHLSGENKGEFYTFMMKSHSWNGCLYEQYFRQ